MPQVHNKNVLEGLDGSAMGKSSRFMDAFNFSMNSTKRMKAIAGVDQKLADLQIKVHERLMQSLNYRYSQIQEKMKEKLRNYNAYKIVLSTDSFCKIPNYQDALNREYNYKAMKPKIVRTLEVTHPSYLREQRARMQLDKSRFEAKAVIEKSLRQIHSPRERHIREHKQELKRLANVWDTDAPHEVDAKDNEEIITDIVGTDVPGMPAFKKGPGLVTKPYYGRTILKTQNKFLPPIQIKNNLTK